MRTLVRIQPPPPSFASRAIHVSRGPSGGAANDCRRAVALAWFFPLRLRLIPRFVRGSERGEWSPGPWSRPCKICIPKKETSPWQRRGLASSVRPAVLKPIGFDTNQNRALSLCFNAPEPRRRAGRITGIHLFWKHSKSLFLSTSYLKTGLILSLSKDPLFAEVL